MAKTYGIVSTKGGVGKTTVAANLGGILADMNQRVLIIDADFQQSLSNFYHIVHKAPLGLREALMNANPESCISQTNIPDLHIIYSNDPKQDILTWLRQSSSHVHYFGAMLTHLQDLYDYIIIDTQGAGGILQEAVILASDELISPIPPDYIDSKEFIRGTVKMLSSLELPIALRSIRAAIPPLHGLIYRQDRTNHAKIIAQSLRKQFHSQSNGKVKILQTVIANLSSYKKSAGYKLPVHRIEVKRQGNTPSAHDAMLSLIYELEPHLSDIIPSWDKKSLHSVPEKSTAE